MGNDRELEAKLKFTTEAASATQAKGAIQGVKQETQKAGEEAKRAGDAAAQAGKKTEDAMKKAAQAAKEAQDRLNKVRETGEKLKQVAGTLAITSAAILGPLTLAANKFLSTADEADPRLKRWNDATTRIQASTARVGAVVVEQVLPFLEKGAALVEKVADYAEKHPGAIQAALAIGGSLAVVATLTSVVGTLLQTYGTVATLLGAGGGVSALTAPLTTLAASGGPLATLAASAGPLFLLVAAIGGLTALLNSEFGRQGTTAGGQGLAMAAGGIGQAVGGRATGLTWFAEVGLALGILNQQQYEAAKAEAARAREIEHATRAQRENERAMNYSSNAIVRQAQIQVEAATRAATIWERLLLLFSTQPKVGTGKAMGGYASTPALYPLAENGRREFVLNAATTRALEAAVGGSLTQQRVTNLARVNSQTTIHGDMSPAMRSGLRREIGAAVGGALEAAFKG